MLLTADLADELDDDAGAAFDAFAAAAPFAAYQQSRAWVRVVPRTRVQDYLYFRCHRGGTLVGVAVIRRTRLLAGKWLGTLQRGPLVHDPELLGTVIERLMAACRAAGCCTVQLAPRVRGRALPDAAETMRAAGLAPLPDDRQPLHSATGIVWLDKPEAEILAGFKQRGRRQLKAAAKAGVTVRPAQGGGDIAIYQRLLDGFRAARPDYDMAGLPDAAGQAALIAALGGGMLIAERDGRPIGGHAFVRQADEAIWLSLATSEDEADVPRAYPLLWEAMRAARAMGCVGYDLAGLPMAEPRDPGEASRMQFKNAFAPWRRVLPRMQIVALKPVSHALLFGARQAYRAARARA